jgi:uncharacterized Ntn-hydrolase superfamily protein
MRLIAAAVVALVLIAPPAAATWSVVAADSETQEVVVASATCVAGLDLKRYLPVVVVGSGGGAAQSYVDSAGTRRQVIWDGLHDGWTAQQIIDELIATHPAYPNHQHGVAEATIGTAASETGSTNGAHASGVTGRFGTVAYAIQGNVLTGEPVIAMAEDAFVNTVGDLPARAMAAMEAARSMGGDGRCSCSPSNPTGCGSPPSAFDKSAHVGFFIISRYGDTDDVLCNSLGCADGDYFMDFNIAFQNDPDPDPVDQLQALFDAARSDLLGRPDAIASTVTFSEIAPPGGEWLLRVELRDWQGALLGTSVSGLTVVHALDSDQVTTIGPVVDNGDGSYEINLTETGPPGVDIFLVTADDGVRPVVLPPRRTTLDLDPLFADGFESGDTTQWSASVP